MARKIIVINAKIRTRAISLGKNAISYNKKIMELTVAKSKDSKREQTSKRKIVAEAQLHKIHSMLYLQQP